MCIFYVHIFYDGPASLRVVRPLERIKSALISRWLIFEKQWSRSKQQKLWIKHKNRLIENVSTESFELLIRHNRARWFFPQIKDRSDRRYSLRQVLANLSLLKAYRRTHLKLNLLYLKCVEWVSCLPKWNTPRGRPFCYRIEVIKFMWVHIGDLIDNYDVLF